MTTEEFVNRILRETREHLGREGTSLPGWKEDGFGRIWALTFGYNTFNVRQGRFESISNYFAALKLLPKKYVDIISFRDYNGAGTTYWIAVKVRTDKRGLITEAARILEELHARMENYPLLDERDYCEREYEYQLSVIENTIFSGHVAAGAPDDWPKKIFGEVFDTTDGDMDTHIWDKALLYEAGRRIGVIDDDEEV